MNFLSDLAGNLERKGYAARGGFKAPVAQPGVGGIRAGSVGTPAAVSRNAGLAQLQKVAAPSVGPTWKDRLAIFAMALGDNDAGVAALNKKIEGRGADAAKAAERRRLMDLARTHNLSDRETLAFITKPEAWAERNAGRTGAPAAAVGAPDLFDDPIGEGEAWSLPIPKPPDNGYGAYDPATGEATYGALARSYGYDPTRIIDSSGPAAPPPAPASGGAPMPNARKAKDGKWYVPDPNRPGKYRRVD